jgi:hypothetical protein
MSGKIIRNGICLLDKRRVTPGLQRKLQTLMLSALLARFSREMSVEILTKIVNDISNVVTKFNRTHYERNEAEASMISRLVL